jgi:hypothetical protein
MGNVNADGIWTPDEEDTLEPDVWSSQMADSISQGLGVRMAKQEKFEGAYLNIQTPFTLTAGEPGHTQKALPFARSAGVTYLDGGMTLSGGVLTVAEAGLYSVSATILAHISSGYLELTLWRNGDRHGQVVTYDDGSVNPIGLNHTAVMKCVPGDKIWASGAQYFGDYENPPTLHVTFNLFNTLSVTLVQAF